MSFSIIKLWKKPQSLKLEPDKTICDTNREIFRLFVNLNAKPSLTNYTLPIVGSDPDVPVRGYGPGRKLKSGHIYTVFAAGKKAQHLLVKLGNLKREETLELKKIDLEWLEAFDAYKEIVKLVFEMRKKNPDAVSESEFLFLVTRIQTAYFKLARMTVKVSEYLRAKCEDVNKEVAHSIVARAIDPFSDFI